MSRITVGRHAPRLGLDRDRKKVSRLRANAKRASVQACSPCSLPGGYRGWPPRSCTVVTRGCTGVVRSPNERTEKWKKADVGASLGALKMFLRPGRAEFSGEYVEHSSPPTVGRFAFANYWRAGCLPIAGAGLQLY